MADYPFDHPLGGGYFLCFTNPLRFVRMGVCGQAKSASSRIAQIKFRALGSTNLEVYFGCVGLTDI